MFIEKKLTMLNIKFPSKKRVEMENQLESVFDQFDDDFFYKIKNEEISLPIKEILNEVTNEVAES